MYAYVARQPIFNKSKKINGYELLFRGGMENSFPDVDGDEATLELLSTTFMTTNINDYTGGKQAFINFTRNLLVNKTPMLFPKETTVVEILETVDSEEAVVDACQHIARQGYTIALDDFVYDSTLLPLIDLADIIKFDFRQSSIDKIVSDIHQLPRYDLKLLAEKVETYEEFQTAIELGFDYFQGYFFSRPEVIKRKKLSPVKINLIRIMGEISQRQVDYSKLDNYISSDVSLSFKLLRYVNSSFFRRTSEISSIQQAIIMLGENEVRRFISMMALGKLSDDKPKELVKVSSIRAKFCELLTLAAKSASNPNELFMLGLFSLIDAILDISMETIMDDLPLSNQLKDALIKNQGFEFYFLRLAISYEKGDWSDVTFCSNILDIPENQLPGLYLDALKWGDMIVNL